MSESRLSFFRQSGWLLIASNLGGALMWLVHTVARRMPADEYSVMTTLLQSLIFLGSIGVAVQSVFAQQAAAAVTEEAQRHLRAAVWRVAVAVFVVWLAGAFLTWAYSSKLLADYRIANPAALWMAAVFALLQLWLPISTGLLQGRQDFLWLGWTGIINGGVRLAAVVLIVVVLGGQAAGGLAGAIFGMTVVLAITIWRSRAVWMGARSDFDWSEWLRAVLPLAAGIAAVSFALTADVMFVRRNFSGEESGFYNAAGMVGRALAAFTAPLTAVMFPKIAAAAARSEKSDAMVYALGATALLGVGAAVFFTLFPELPIRVIQGEKYLPAAKLIPKLSWCILPVTLGTVLVSSLLAHRRFVIVPWLLGVALAYVGALMWFGTSLERVIYTLGACGLLVLTISAWFTWRR